MISMNNNITIYDISKKAEVSIATVSRVLNGSSAVKPKTRDKVLSVIEEYGYKPNAFARGLGLNSMKTIGILCADSSDLYLAKAVYYIEENLRKNGYNSILCCTGFLQEDRENSINLLLSQHVDSIILIGSQYIGEAPEQNQYIIDAAKKTPIMLLNGELSDENIYSIVCDDKKAVMDATTKVLSTGAKNILYLHSSETFSEKKKLQGFLDACSKAGISKLTSEENRALNNEFVDSQNRNSKSYDDNSTSKFYSVMKYSESHEDIDKVKETLQTGISKIGLSFDAIVCSQDYLAVGAMKYAAANGISVPDKLQIVGYNDSILTMCTEPSLSSINNKLETMCSKLIDVLISVLSGEMQNHTFTFNATLVEKGTTL